MGSKEASDTVTLVSAVEAECSIAERAGQVDAIVTASFASHLMPQFSQGVAAIAVGGYGRRELFPYSDIDILLLIAKEVDPKAIKDPLGLFLRDLWDAGLRMSHSVHTVEECIQVYEQNVELSISQLDRRLLAGDTALYAELETILPRFYKLHGATVARHLARITRARHAKFSSTIYHLEPNIKESPGALRDIQVVRWLSRLLPGRPAPDLGAAWRFLSPLRLFLHEASRRDNNLLSFDMQDAMSGNPGEMMRNYFRDARGVFACVTDILEAAEESQPSLIRQFRDWRSRLSNSEFTVSRERVYLRSSSLLEADPGAVWRLLEFMARHGVSASKELEHKLAAAAPGIGKELTKKPFWASLKVALSQPKVSFALRLLQRTGLMTALFPEWARIDCLVVRDFYHRYTVDEHTIVTIEVLENLAEPRFKDLLAETQDIALVKFALLFHDSGKGSGREHVAESVRIMTEVGRRIGISNGDLETTCQLIAGHLILSTATTSRDLDDVNTGRLLAQRVGTVEHLKMLTLLTFADISAVNPTAMTPWRSDQLWRAYLLGHQELTTELETARIRSFSGADEATARFVEGLPERYLRTHSLDQIKSHVALAERVPVDGAAVELVRSTGYWQAVVAAADRPGLFSSIAGGLAAFGMNILKAEAFANSSGVVLDTFAFSDPLRTLELNPTEVDRLRDTLARVVRGKLDVRKLLAGRHPTAKLSQQVEAKVAFNNKASQTATLIEIVAEDRPGLLYDLASTMSRAGCDIVVVLIDTEANKALDVFYVTINGGKVDGTTEASLREALLTVCTK